jgi:anthranilate synthase/aminodeoxychorismate synthase-like glutamine amidotransferase
MQAAAGLPADLRVVVVDHYDSYTWNLVHLVASVTGVLPTVVEHDSVSISELAAYTHVVLSPGPGHPATVADFEVGRQVLSRAAVPVLGVCLGMQGLVAAYGGRVVVAEPAHGDVEMVCHDGTGLFTGLPTPYPAVRYHSLAAVEMPSSLRANAWAADGTVMAVAHRTLPLVGVQFHPESVLTEHGTELVANFFRGCLR